MVEGVGCLCVLRSRCTRHTDTHLHFLALEDVRPHEKGIDAVLIGRDQSVALEPPQIMQRQERCAAIGCLQLSQRRQM